MLLTRKRNIFSLAIVLPLILSGCKPEIKGKPPAQAQSCKNYNFTPIAFDGDGDDLSFSIANKPVWASFSENSGTLSGTPGQSDTGAISGIVIDVHADGESADEPLSFDINVIAANDQIPEWTELEGTGESELSYGMTTDNEGNAISAGYSRNTQAEGDKFDVNVMKVAKNGTVIWSKNFSSSEHEIAYDAAVDSHNNIYISGMTKGNFGDVNASCLADEKPDPFVAKLDPEGTMLWARMICSDGAGLARGIAVDANDNVYVAGNVIGDIDGIAALGKNDAFIAKFDTDGTRQYLTQIGSDDHEFPYSLVVDNNGNAYMAGNTKGIIGAENLGKDDIFISKIASDGSVVWTTQYGSDTTDKNPAIAIDTANSMLYVTGQTKGALEPGGVNAGSYDVFLTAMNFDGAISWTKQFGTDQTDTGEDLIVDNNGSIFIAGNTNTIPEVGSKHADITLRKVSPEGALLSENLYGTTKKDYAYGISLSDCGFVYIGGYSRGDLNGETHSPGLNDRFIMHIDGSK